MKPTLLNKIVLGQLLILQLLQVEPFNFRWLFIDQISILQNEMTFKVLNH